MDIKSWFSNMASTVKTNGGANLKTALIAGVVSFIAVKTASEGKTTHEVNNTVENVANAAIATIGATMTDGVMSTAMTLLPGMFSLGKPIADKMVELTSENFSTVASDDAVRNAALGCAVIAGAFIFLIGSDMTNGLVQSYRGVFA